MSPNDGDDYRAPWDYSSNSLIKCDVCGVLQRPTDVMTLSNDKTSLTVCIDRDFCVRACNGKVLAKRVTDTEGD